MKAKATIDVWEPKLSPQSDKRFCPGPVKHYRFGTERMVPREPHKGAARYLENPLKEVPNDSLEYKLTNTFEEQVEVTI